MSMETAPEVFQVCVEWPDVSSLEVFPFLTWGEAFSFVLARGRTYFFGGHPAHGIPADPEAVGLPRRVQIICESRFPNSVHDVRDSKITRVLLAESAERGFVLYIKDPLAFFTLAEQQAFGPFPVPEAHPDFRKWSDPA